MIPHVWTGVLALSSPDNTGSLLLWAKCGWGPHPFKQTVGSRWERVHGQGLPWVCSESSDQKQGRDSLTVVVLLKSDKAEHPVLLRRGMERERSNPGCWDV